jgi:hypothetical protein
VARVILFLPLLGGTEASFPLALFTTLADAAVDELPLVTGVGTTGVVFFDFGVVLPTSLSLAFPLRSITTPHSNSLRSSNLDSGSPHSSALRSSTLRSSDGLNSSSLLCFIKWYLTAL